MAELRADKQRLEETIYRLKTESRATDVALKETREKLDLERKAVVGHVTVMYS